MLVRWYAETPACSVAGSPHEISSPVAQGSPAWLSLQQAHQRAWKCITERSFRNDTGDPPQNDIENIANKSDEPLSQVTQD